jgi:hypothetical protein
MTFLLLSSCFFVMKSEGSCLNSDHSVLAVEDEATDLSQRLVEEIDHGAIVEFFLLTG